MQACREFVLVAFFLSAFAPGLAAQAPAGMSTRDLVVHGHHLAFHLLPGHLPALILDAVSLALTPATGTASSPSLLNVPAPRSSLTIARVSEPK